MFKSRKYMIWFWTFIAFVGLSILVILVTKSAEGIVGIETSLALISGVYHGTNVAQKMKVQNEIK